MQWIRVDANLDDHPKAVDAGFWGVVAVQVVWRLIKRHGDRGRLSAKYVTERHLRHVTRCDAETALRLLSGVEDAIRSGFLVKDEDGHIEAHGWDEVQWDSTHAKRQRDYRERQKSRDGGDKSRDAVTDVTRTPPHPTPPQPHPDQLEKGRDRPAAPPPDATVKESKSKRVRTIEVDPSTSNGLKDTERIRRFAYLRWTSGPGAGAAYPQDPEADDQIARDLLNYHRESKAKMPWERWVQAVIVAYFDLDDPWLREHSYAFRFLTRTRLAQIVSTMGGQS